VSAHGLHESVLRLHAIADALEAGVSTSWPTSPQVLHVQPAELVVAPEAVRSTARAVVSAMVSSSAAAAVLVAAFALADPLLPHADRPSLAAHAEVVSTGPGWLPSIPESGANRP